MQAARQLAAGLDPREAAERCGVEFAVDETGSGGIFTIPFLGSSERISFPELEFGDDSRLPPHVCALLVYYLARCTGSEPSGEWRSFADLPDGRIYAQAFQGYTGNALVRRTGGMADKLHAGVVSLGGRLLEPDELATNADVAWVIPALPKVPVALVWWDSDDEFPARAELLFDATASKHLPIDGCAVTGSWLVNLLAADVERLRG